ncbi:MAG: hypothetical protein AB1609_00360 [Bacillota bacterium]
MRRSPFLGTCRGRRRGRLRGELAGRLSVPRRRLLRGRLRSRLLGRGRRRGGFRLLACRTTRRRGRVPFEGRLALLGGNSLFASGTLVGGRPLVRDRSWLLRGPDDGRSTRRWLDNLRRGRRAVRPGTRGRGGSRWCGRPL